MHEQLRESLESSDARFISVVAPAGYGKSVMLAYWQSILSSRSQATGWLHLDSFDIDFSFWTHLAESFKRIDPALMFDWVPQIAEANIPAEKWADGFINELSKVSQPITLFIENYQEIYSKDINKAMQRIATYLPQNVRIVISSRQRLPIDTSHLLMRGLAQEYLSQDLAFNFKETHRYLQKSMPSISLEDTWRVYNSTKGWIACIKTVAITLRRTGSTEILELLDNITDSDQEISLFSALCNDMLDTLGMPSRNLLIATASLDQISADLCDHILEIDYSQRILEHIARQDFFVVHAADGWYQLHPLFRSHLMRIAEEQPEEMRRRHLSRAIAWLSEHDMLNSAISSCLQCGEYELALTFIEDLYFDNGPRSSFSVPVISAMQSIPAENIAAHPRGLVALLVALVSVGDIDQLESFFKKMDGYSLSSDMFDQEERITERYADIANMLISYTQRDYERSIEFANASLANKEPSGYRIDGMLMILASRSYTALGKIDKAKELLQMSIDNAFDHQMQEEYLMSLCEYARLQANSGDLMDAENAIRRGLSEAKRNGLQGPVVDFLRFFMRIAHREQGMIDEFERLIDENQRFVAEQLSSFSGWFYAPNFFLELSMSFRSLGKFDLSEKYFRRAKDSLKGHLSVPCLAEQIVFERIKLWLVSGQDHLISDWLRTNQPKRYSRYTPIGAMRIVAVALALLAQNKPKAVLELLSKDLPDDKPLIYIAFAIDYHMIKAWAILRTAGPEQAKGHVMIALQRARKGNYIEHFVSWGPWFLPMLLEIAEDTENQSSPYRTMHDYMQQVIGAIKDAYPDFDSAPSWQRQAQNSSEIKLSARERQILQLLLDGLAPRAIAEECHISISTVNTHINKIYEKLDVHNRADALAKAKDLL